MNKFVILLFFLVLSAFGQNADDVGLDISLRDPNLSLKYQKGEYLVYDCGDKHFVCTALPEYKRCLNQLNYDLENNEIDLSCAPLKKFNTNNECIKEQKRLVHSSIYNGMCENPNKREIEKVF